MQIKQAKNNKSSTTSVSQKDRNRKNVKPTEPVVEPINLNTMPDLSHPMAANYRQAYFTWLQQTHGNQFVQRMVKQHVGEVLSMQGQVDGENTQIQAKLIIGPPDDKYEQEADRIADAAVSKLESQASQEIAVSRRVQGTDSQQLSLDGDEEMRMQLIGENEEDELLQTSSLSRGIKSNIQRQNVETEEPEEETRSLENTAELNRRDEELRAKTLDKIDLKKGLTQTNVTTKLNLNSSGSRSIEPHIKANMESFFGRRFNTVHIHTDKQSALMCQNLNARAFTLGNNVYFGAGEYRPTSNKGNHLLAHELTHVIQQGKDGGHIIQRVSSSSGKKQILRPSISNFFPTSVQLNSVNLLNNNQLDSGDFDFPKGSSMAVGTITNENRTLINNPPMHERIIPSILLNNLANQYQANILQRAYPRGSGWRVGHENIWERDLWWDITRQLVSRTTIFRDATWVQPNGACDCNGKIWFTIERWNCVDNCFATADDVHYDVYWNLEIDCTPRTEGVHCQYNCYRETDGYHRIHASLEYDTDNMDAESILSIVGSIASIVGVILGAAALAVAL